MDKTEVAIDPEKSTLNKHVNEIIYFFEAVKYDAVIFEDLDRYNNLEIFITLREINQLLKNSEQINRKITFIYALRDDIFAEKTDRIKFFEFIIPIVSVMNSSNACEILTEKFNNYGLGVDEKFISDITIYIDEMRILNNIFNEFLIYKGLSQ